MAISTIRKMEESDTTRLHNAAKRFIENHFSESVTDGEYALSKIDYYLIPGSNHYDVVDLRRKWARIMCRAFRVNYASNISYGWGYIGYYID